MAEDIRKAVRDRIAANKDKEHSESIARLSQAAAQERRAKLIGRISSRGGMPIRELPSGFATEESRRLLAGLVASATRARIPKHIENTRSHAGMGGKLIGMATAFRGWKVGLAQFNDNWGRGGTFTNTHRGLVTSDFGIFVDEWTMNGSRHVYDKSKTLHRIHDGVLRESVVEILADHGAAWVEPEPSTYS